MKNLKLIGLFVIGFGLFACGGDTNSENSEEGSTAVKTEETKPDREGMEMVDLSDYDIPATLYAPDESKGKRQITATEWGSVQIESGKRYGIEIVPFGMAIAEKKAELKNASVYTNEIISETANKIVYKRAIKGTEVEPEVHFFMNVEIDGDVYEVKSLDKSYNEKAVEKMVTSVESMKAKDAA